jgi:hypothetical protein
MAGKSEKRTGVRKRRLAFAQGKLYRKTKGLSSPRESATCGGAKKGLTNSRLYGNFCIERNNRND